MKHCASSDSWLKIFDFHLIFVWYTVNFVETKLNYFYLKSGCQVQPKVISIL